MFRTRPKKQNSTVLRICSHTPILHRCKGKNQKTKPGIFNSSLFLTDKWKISILFIMIWNKSMKDNVFSVLRRVVQKMSLELHVKNVDQAWSRIQSKQNLLWKLPTVFSLPLLPASKSKQSAFLTQSSSCINSSCRWAELAPSALKFSPCPRSLLSHEGPSFVLPAGAEPRVRQWFQFGGWLSSRPAGLQIHYKNVWLGRAAFRRQGLSGRVIGVGVTVVVYWSIVQPFVPFLWLLMHLLASRRESERDWPPVHLLSLTPSAPLCHSVLMHVPRVRRVTTSFWRRRSGYVHVDVRQYFKTPRGREKKRYYTMVDSYAQVSLVCLSSKMDTHTVTHTYAQGANLDALHLRENAGKRRHSPGLTLPCYLSEC